MTRRGLSSTTSQPLTRIGITYAQLLQEERIFPRVFSPVEPKICTKMLKKMSKNSEQNCCHLKIARLDDAF